MKNTVNRNVTKPHIVRTTRFERRDKRGKIHLVAITPEMKLQREEKMAKTLAGPSRRSHPINVNDGLPITFWEDARHHRAHKARGHILAVSRITGESPYDIMDRLGLTDEERSHIAPFRIIWE